MSSNISNFRSWMNNQWDSNGQISKEFAEGLKEFMRFAGNQDITLRGEVRCFVLVFVVIIVNLFL